jgi:hypothetical protein
VPVPVDGVLVDVRVVRCPPAEVEVAQREEDVMVRGAPAVGAEGGSPWTEAEGAQPMDGGAAREGKFPTR